MSFKRKYNMRVELIPLTDNRPCMRQGTKIKPIFGVAHDTGNKNATAQNHLDLAMRMYDEQWSWAHCFVDNQDIIIMVPMFETSEKCCHVLYNKPLDNELFGDDANDIGLSIELCYFNDKNRTLEGYKKYVHMWAYVCYYYDWNPLEKIIGHHVLDPSRKTDPMNAFNIIGKTFEQFLQDVKNELDECTKEEIKIDENKYNFEFLGKKIKLDSLEIKNGISKIELRELFEKIGIFNIEYNEDDKLISIKLK